jgi:hypothetical protein
MMLPVFTDIKSWANSLIIDFPKDDIPQLHDADDWKSWGNILIQTTTFSDNNAPFPDNYTDPMKWAKDVFYAINTNE